MFELPGVSSLPALDIPKVSIPAPPIAYSYSDTQVEIIKDYVLKYQDSLDPSKDVALLLTHFGIPF